MRPAHGVAVGAALACALRLVAGRLDTPIPIASASPPPPVSIPTNASAPADETAPPLPPEPPIPSDAPLFSGVEGGDGGLQLARRCLALAERDPLAAMELAAAHQLQNVDSGLPASLIAQWASRDFDRAWEWTRTQAAGAWRDDMLARLAHLRARTDPIAAARLVAIEISAGPIRDEAVVSVVHQWALQDARSAGLWVQSLPDASLRQRASAEIAGRVSGAE